MQARVLDRHPKFTAGTIVLLLFAAVVAMRMLAPSDLNGTDQHRTMSYTLDMLLRGGERLILPQDSWGFGATKPPLTNWVGLPFLATFGPSEFVYKLPSLLFGLLATAVVATAGWLFAQPRQKALIAVLSAAAFLTGETIAERLYYARPDMPLVAMTAGAWLTGTVALRRRHLRQDVPTWMAGVFWLFVTLGLLAKGPPALVPVVYVVIAARVCFGRWGHVRGLGLWWGLPASVAIFGLWLLLAARVDGEHAQSVLVGEEVSRVSDGAARIFKDVYRMPKYFIEKFLPWSILFFLGLPLMRRGGRLWNGCTGPAVLYVLVWLVILTLPASKRSVYLAPAYVAAAPVAALGLLSLLRRIDVRSTWAAVPVAAAFGWMAWHFHFASLPATTNRGEHLQAFAARVAEIVVDDEVAFVDEGSNPLQSLLGRHAYAAPPTDVKWLVTQQSRRQRRRRGGDIWPSVGRRWW